MNKTEISKLSQIVGVDVAPMFDSPYRSTPVKIATFGDSTANVVTISSGDAYNADQWPLKLSWSIPLSNLSRTYSPIANYYPAAIVSFNGGISGDSLNGMAGREGDVTGKQFKSISAVIESNPDVIFYRGGSINSLSGVNTANYDATVNAAIATHKSILTRLVSSGKPILDFGIFGINETFNPSVSGTFPEIKRAIVQLNSEIKQFIKTYHAGRVWFIDPEGVISTDGTLNSFATNDGVHLNFVGGSTLSKNLELPIMEYLFGKSSFGVFGGGANLITNTTSTAGYTTAGTSANSSSAVVQIDGVQWHEFTFSPFAPQSPGNFFVTIPWDYSTIALNDLVNAGFDISVSKVGVTKFHALDIRCNWDLRFNNGADRRVYQSMSVGETDIDSNELIRFAFPPTKYEINGAQVLVANTSIVIQLQVPTQTGEVYKIRVRNQRSFRMKDNGKLQSI